MSTDLWPQEDQAIFDANSYILPCYPDGAISEMSAVKPGTTVAGRISVAVGAVLGDSYGIALKAATGAGVPERIPILFFGVAKLSLTATHTCTAGSGVMNNTTTTFSSGASLGITFISLAPRGSSHIMGTAIQGGGGPAAARSDEILVLVGRVL